MYREVHGFKNGKPLPRWKRISTEDIDYWRKENQELDTLLYTIQQFDDPKSADGEPHIAPLYFDLDYKEDVSKALEDCRVLVEYFIAKYEVSPLVWFSGSKGFHVEIAHEYFDVVPHPKLTYHWRYLAEYFMDELHLTTVDLGVYTIPRMWRIPNTKNPKSSLYKIPIGIGELRTLDIDGIKALAKNPREVNEIVEDVPLPIDELERLYSQAVDKYSDSTKADLTFVEANPTEFNDNLPPCIQYLFDNKGVVKLGFRNRTSMVLASYYKDAAVPIEHAAGFMNEWVKVIPEVSTMTTMEGYNLRKTAALAVLKSVYSNSKYHFTCGSILACGVPNTLCAGCKSIGIIADEVKFEDYSRAENIGKYISVEADAIGKDEKELIVPKSISASCLADPNRNSCLTCPMSMYYNPKSMTNERTIDINSKNPAILEIVDQTAGHINIVIQKMFGVQSKRCDMFRYNVEYANAQYVHLTNTINQDFRIETQPKRAKAVILFHGLELNRSYKFYGRVYQNPRSRAATLVIDKVEPMQTMLEVYVPSKESIEQFKMFQADGGDVDSIMSKIKEIHRMFRDSFIYVFGRDELILAVDMVFHSVRWMNFQRQRIKGWLDILVLGDTRQGKSDVAKKLMRYYKLGTMAAGESTSRTGLLYSIHMSGNEPPSVVFGLLPRSNGYLVVVDEIHGMPQEDFKEFTQVRSEGVVDVKKVAYGTAHAETRLISIANARSGMTLGSYGFPVQAITDIPAFKSMEDVSRFDYAVGVRAGDVSDQEINTNVNDIVSPNNPYTPEICRELILWIWTRTPEQIIISDDTESLCLLYSQKVADEYVSDIPLIEVADVRHKLMRMAIAFAGRTFNSFDGETLIVDPAHIMCAYSMLNILYKSKGLDYWGYSEEQAHLVLTNDNIKDIISRFHEMLNWRDVAGYLLVQTAFTRPIFMQSTALPKETADKLITLLLNCRLIEPATNMKSGGFYRKTTVGRGFLKNLVDGKYEDGVYDVVDNVIEQTYTVDKDGF